MKIEKVRKTGFLKQAPNVFTSFRPIMKKGGERRARYKSELRERCIAKIAKYLSRILAWAIDWSRLKFDFVLI